MAFGDKMDTFTLPLSQTAKQGKVFYEIQLEQMGKSSVPKFGWVSPGFDPSANSTTTTNNNSASTSSAVNGGSSAGTGGGGGRNGKGKGGKKGTKSARGKSAKRLVFRSSVRACVDVWMVVWFPFATPCPAVPRHAVVCFAVWCVHARLVRFG